MKTWQEFNHVNEFFKIRKKSPKKKLDKYVTELDNIAQKFIKKQRTSDIIKVMEKFIKVVDLYIPYLLDVVSQPLELDKLDEENLRKTELIDITNRIINAISTINRVRVRCPEYLHREFTHKQELFNGWVNKINKLYGNKKEDNYNTHVVTNNKLFNAYKVLEISPDATNDEVKNRYRKLAIKYHPDKVAHTGNKEDIKDSEELSNAWDEIKKERGLK